MISPTEIRYCSASNPYTCAVSYWCHIGASEQTTLCCPGKGLSNVFPFVLFFSLVSPQEVCQQPLQVGNGFSNLPRWYYNPATQCCLPFSYRGTLGNENNFLTKEACEDQCGKKRYPTWLWDIRSLYGICFLVTFVLLRSEYRWGPMSHRLLIVFFWI